MQMRRGVSTAVFAGTSIVLIIVAAIGFSLYLTSPNPMHTTTETTTVGMSTTSGEMGSEAIEFTPATGQMIHSGWLLIEPTGMGDYALSINAEGLESTQSMGSDYIVEGAESSGSMAVVPIGPNVSSSEFETSSTGVGSFFIILGQNPATTFENVQIVYLPGMSMTDAAVVATADLTMS